MKYMHVFIDNFYFQGKTVLLEGGKQEELLVTIFPLYVCKFLVEWHLFERVIYVKLGRMKKIDIGK